MAFLIPCDIGMVAIPEERFYAPAVKRRRMRRGEQSGSIHAASMVTTSFLFLYRDCLWECSEMSRGLTPCKLQTPASEAGVWWRNNVPAMSYAAQEERIRVI